MIMPQSHRIHKHLSHGPHLPNTRVPITTSTTKRPRSFQLVRTFNNSSPTQVWNLSVDKTFVKKSIYILTVWAIDLSPTLLLASLKTRIILAIRNTWIMNIYGYDLLEHPLTKHCKIKLPMITCFVTMRCNHFRYCPPSMGANHRLMTCMIFLKEPSWIASSPAGVMRNMWK